MSNPALDPQEKSLLVKHLMEARRAVKEAKGVGYRDAEAKAHHAVDKAKRALGERGPVWWKDGAADLNRNAVKNTPYADWYSRFKRA